MIRYYRRIRHGPSCHPSSDDWTCAICGALVPLHGARAGWYDSDTALPPTCSDEHRDEAIAMIRDGVRFQQEGTR